MRGGRAGNGINEKDERATVAGAGDSGARRMRELGRRLKRRRRGERWPEFVWVAGECRVAFLSLSSFSVCELCAKT